MEKMLYKFQVSWSPAGMTPLLEQPKYANMWDWDVKAGANRSFTHSCYTILI